MRQAGILAAAGLYALDHNIERLKRDHENARILLDVLSSLRGCDVDPESVQTNIVIADIARTGLLAEQIVQKLREKRVLIGDAGLTRIRFVTHLDVSTSDVQAAAGVVREVFAQMT
jgi:threonine aldolase